MNQIWSRNCYNGIFRRALPHFKHVFIWLPSLSRKLTEWTYFSWYKTNLWDSKISLLTFKNNGIYLYLNVYCLSVIISMSLKFHYICGACQKTWTYAACINTHAHTHKHLMKYRGISYSFCQLTTLHHTVVICVVKLNTLGLLEIMNRKGFERRRSSRFKVLPQNSIRGTEKPRDHAYMKRICNCLSSLLSY